MTREAFLLAGLRTPRGKGSARGALASVSPLGLLTRVLDALVARGIDPSAVDDVIVGCATQVDAQGANLARTAALLSGIPAPGVTLNRFCASGLDAANTAAARVRAGDASLVLAGGVESVSRVPMLSDRGPLYADPAVAQALGSVHMGVSADLIATMEGFERAALDAYALETREKARAAWSSGDAARSVIAVRGDDGRELLARDELLSYAPSLEDLAALPPAFAEAGAQGQDALACARLGIAEVRHLHTRASSPAPADCAAMLALGDALAGERCGLRPRARVVATATCAGDPVVMLTAGQDAAERALARAGLRAKDLDAFVFAEAFSATCLRARRDLALDDGRFNPWGGTMALGHAFGATGAVLLLEAADLLDARGGRYALAAVSGAAGLGVATVIERV